MKQMYLMVGVPGSGKTTWLAQNVTNTTIISNDDYFTSKTGKYTFDPTKRDQALQASIAKAKKVMFLGKDIAIDNCNLTDKAKEPWISLANQYGYNVKIIRIDTAPEIAFKRNIHNVSQSAIRAMYEQFQKNS